MKTLGTETINNEKGVQNVGFNRLWVVGKTAKSRNVAGLDLEMLRILLKKFRLLLHFLKGHLTRFIVNFVLLFSIIYYLEELFITIHEHKPFLMFH